MVIRYKYLIEELTEIPRKGLAKIMFKKPSKKMRILVELSRGLDSALPGSRLDCSAEILDKDLRGSTEKILRQLDKKSGEEYSFNITYSNEIRHA